MKNEQKNTLLSAPLHNPASSIHEYILKSLPLWAPTPPRGVWRKKIIFIEFRSFWLQSAVSRLWTIFSLGELTSPTALGSVATIHICRRQSLPSQNVEHLRGLNFNPCIQALLADSAIHSQFLSARRMSVLRDQFLPSSTFWFGVTRKEGKRFAPKIVCIGIRSLFSWLFQFSEYSKTITRPSTRLFPLKNQRSQMPAFELGCGLTT